MGSSDNRICSACGRACWPIGGAGYDDSWLCGVCELHASRYDKEIQIQKHLPRLYEWVTRERPAFAIILDFVVGNERSVAHATRRWIHKCILKKWQGRFSFNHQRWWGAILRHGDGDILDYILDFVHG